MPLLKVWEKRGVALQQGYGMTETGPAVMTLSNPCVPCDVYQVNDKAEPTETEPPE